LASLLSSFSAVAEFHQGRKKSCSIDTMHHHRIVTHVVLFVVVSVSLLLLMVADAAAASSSSSAVAAWNRGHVDWVTWSQAIPLAKRERKPIMMVVHKTWCAACRAVGEAFATSPEAELLSKYFVMANVEDDDEPSDKKYAIQGQYNPRVLFLYPDGEVADIVNEKGDPTHLHFYPEISDLVKSMIQALKVIAGVQDIGEL
jgi:protein-disulfide reductase (glutathione)